MLATLCLSRAVAYSTRPELVSRRLSAVRPTQLSRFMTIESSDDRTSVSGTVYLASEGDPVVTLFTKDGCTLCDKVKDVSED